MSLDGRHPKNHTAIIHSRLTMNVASLFRSEEVVQVLDETTFIWEAAKVVGIISDWSLRLKWLNWSGSVDITVPENVRGHGQEHWNVRKPLRKTPVVEEHAGRPRRRAATQHSHPDGNLPYTGKPAMLTRSVEVNVMITQQICIELPTIVYSLSIILVWICFGRCWYGFCNYYNLLFRCSSGMKRATVCERGPST